MVVDRSLEELCYERENGELGRGSCEKLELGGNSPVKREKKQLI